MKKLKIVCVLGLIFILLPSYPLHALTKDTLAELKDEHFQDRDAAEVKEIEYENRHYYLIQGSLHNVFNDKKARVQKKLSLLNKGQLFNHIKKNHAGGESISEIELKNWANSLYREEKKQTYLLSYIETKNVSLKYHKPEAAENQKESESAGVNGPEKVVAEKIRATDVDNAARNQIEIIEKYIADNPESLEGYQNVFQYYKLQNDLEKMDTTMERIMELKFLKME